MRKKESEIREEVLQGTFEIFNKAQRYQEKLEAARVILENTSANEGALSEALKTIPEMIKSMNSGSLPPITAYSVVPAEEEVKNPLEGLEIEEEKEPDK